MLATKDADKLIDVGPLDEQRFLLPLGQAAGDNDAAKLAAALELEHFVDGAERLLPGRFNEAAGVHHGKVGVGGTVNKLIAVELQHAKHPLAVDEILRAAEADKAVLALGKLRIGGFTAGPFKNGKLRRHNASVPQTPSRPAAK
jgi:hypothetical protein